jgi:hypothetical protein
VKGHQESSAWETIADLKKQQLTPDAIYNCWCNKMVKEALQSGVIALFDPLVTPAEKWAVYARYPTYHKITGHLNKGFYSSIGYSALMEYMAQKILLTQRCNGKYIGIILRQLSQQVQGAEKGIYFKTHI